MLCSGQLNLLYIWMIQEMRYVVVGEMCLIFGAHLGSAVSPTESTRKGVSEAGGKLYRRNVNEGRGRNQFVL